MIKRYSSVRLLAAGILLMWMTLHAVFAQAIVIVHYALPANTFAVSIISAPDGNLWFTELDDPTKLGRITTAGAVSEFPLGTSAHSIAAGPDGNVWFTSDAVIGKITRTGQVTTFPFASAGAITAGPDGNLYFGDPKGNKIGKITPQGNITEYPTPIDDGIPGAITQGSGGSVWFNSYGCDTCDTSPVNTLGTITPAGVVAQIPIVTALAPSAIVLGPDGNFWITEIGCDFCSPRSTSTIVAKITPSGAVTEYGTPTLFSEPRGIARGADGNLWFTENAVNQVARIAVDGLITEYPVPGSSTSPFGIAAGPDGNLWFTELNSNRIGKIVLAGAATGVSAVPALAADAALVLCACLILAAYFFGRRRFRRQAT